MRSLRRKWFLWFILSLVNQIQSSVMPLRRASDCKWREIADIYSNGTTIFYAKAFDIDSCKQACLELIDDCIAVEYHSNPLCWYISSNNKISNYIREPGKGYMQFWLDCRVGLANVGGIPCHWQEVRDMQSKGSVLYLKAKGIEECKNACIQDIPGCVAIDNHGNDYCLYHTNRTSVLNRREKVSAGKGYVQFVRVGQCGKKIPE